MLAWLAHRDRKPELMDDPSLAADQHEAALRGLERLNRVSGSVRILWPAVQNGARQCSDRPLRVLDIAAGGGDVAIGLWRRAARAGLRLELDGCDSNPRAVEYARRRAAEAQADVQFFVRDALVGSLPESYDVVMCSLFLHHLDDAAAVELLRRMARAASQLVLVNDLARSAGALLLVRLATRLLCNNEVNRVDSERSVRAAFTLREARELAHRAGLSAATVQRRWPCRFLLTWSRT